MDAGAYAAVAWDYVYRNAETMSSYTTVVALDASRQVVNKVHLIVTWTMDKCEISTKDLNTTFETTLGDATSRDQEATTLLTAAVGIAIVLSGSSILGMAGALPPPLKQGIDVALYAIFLVIFGEVEKTIPDGYKAKAEGNRLSESIKVVISDIRTAGKASPAITIITAIASVAIGFFATTLVSILICPLPIVSVLTKMVFDHILLEGLAATTYTTGKIIIADEGVSGFLMSPFRTPVRSLRAVARAVTPSRLFHGGE